MKRGPHIVDLTGKRFGRWTVLAYAESKKYGSVYWLCHCDCGTIKEVHGVWLRNGRSKSCGCYKKERDLERNKIEYGLAAKRRVCNLYLRNAREKNISFELSFEQFLYLVQQNCFYCNSELSNLMKSLSNNGDFKYNGIDRKDNTKGYTIDNCVSCCETCNKAKRDMSFEEFIRWGKRLGNNLNQIEEKEFIKNNKVLTDRLQDNQYVCQA